ncbi:MAG: hypothetical protein WA194_09390 [Patescibacteria group bacterium]
MTDNKKVNGTPAPSGNYAEIKSASIRESYSNSLGNDLQELRGFTLTFTDSLLNV